MSDATAETTPATPDAPATPTVINRVDVTKALKMRLQGFSYDDIADKMGVAKASVYARLKKLGLILDDPELTNRYREHEADLLDSVQVRLITSLAHKSDDKKASVNNLAYAARQVFDMRRLSRGESTANIHQLSAIIQAADAHIPASPIVADTQDVVVDAADEDAPAK